MITVVGESDDAERLAHALNCPVNENAEIAIRYGSSNTVEARININKPDALELAKHKYNSLIRFREFGLPVPNFSLNADKLKFPILGRRFYHACGTDIQFIGNMDSMVECEYYIEFIPVEDEYRYHVVCGKIVNASEKYGGNMKAYCRNLRTGWRYRDVKSYEVHPYVPDLAKWAIKALRLDFGAVDIITSNNYPYLLEVNTAPGIIQRRAELYAHKLKSYIRSVYGKDRA